MEDFAPACRKTGKKCSFGDFVVSGSVHFGGVRVEYTQYGHLMVAATAKPTSSQYFAGIFVSENEYFFISAYS